jgi:predicted phage-related endonuclease
MYLSPEERRAGIGGSDVGSIMGANPYRSPIACWKEKIGELAPPSLNYAMEWGSRLEEVVCIKYAEDKKLFYDNKADCVDDCTKIPNYDNSYNGILYMPHTVRSSKHDWAYAHPDGLVGHNNKANDITGIEIKTVSEGIYRKYWAEGEIPPYQYYQVVWYSMITGISKWTMVGFVPHLRNSQDPILLHELEIDLDTQQRVWKKVEYFWECVQNKTAPELDSYSETDIKLLYPENSVDLIQGNETIENKCTELAQLRKELKPLVEKEELLKNSIKAYMGHCGRLLSKEGNEIATFKSAKARITVNHKGIIESFRKYLTDNQSDSSDWAKSELNHCEAKNTTAVKTSRRFLLKYKGD